MKLRARSTVYVAHLLCVLLPSRLVCRVGEVSEEVDRCLVHVTFEQRGVELRRAGNGCCTVQGSSTAVRARTRSRRRARCMAKETGG